FSYNDRGYAPLILCLLRSEAAAVSSRTVQQPVVRRQEPFRLGLLGKCKMQRIERREAKTRERAGAVSGCRTGRYTEGRRLQPQKGGQLPVFTRIPLVLEIVRGRAHELDLATRCRIQDRGYGFGLAPHSFQRRVIERPFEATDVEVHDLTHLTIVPFQHRLTGRD